MDGLRFLTQDHRSVERLFQAYERTSKGASKRRQQLAGQIIRALARLLDSGKDLVRGTARSATRVVTARLKLAPSSR